MLIHKHHFPLTFFFLNAWTPTFLLILSRSPAFNLDTQRRSSKKKLTSKRGVLQKTWHGGTGIFSPLCAIEIGKVSFFFFKPPSWMRLRSGGGDEEYNVVQGNGDV
jgi:hypothetical protein